MNHLFRSYSIALLFGLGCSASGDDTGLVLDYTAHVEEAVQVSGMATTADGKSMALVTDFEKVVIVDTDSIEAVHTFAVQLGNVPRQGSAEAVGYLANNNIAVLYPDQRLLRVYAAPNYATVARELMLDAVGERLHGALAIDRADVGYFVVGTGQLELVKVSLAAGEVLGRTALSGPVEDEISGLTWGHDAGEPQIWAVSEDNRVYDLDPNSGETTEIDVLEEVSEASAIDALIGHEGEAMLAVADDGNEHNKTAGPIRLYLLGDLAP